MPSLLRTAFQFPLLMNFMGPNPNTSPNSTSTFRVAMNELCKFRSCLVILVYSSDCNQHLQHLQHVLSILQMHQYVQELQILIWPNFTVHFLFYINLCSFSRSHYSKFWCFHRPLQGLCNSRMASSYNPTSFRHLRGMDSLGLQASIAVLRNHFYSSDFSPITMWKILFSYLLPSSFLLGLEIFKYHVLIFIHTILSEVDPHIV